MTASDEELIRLVNDGYTLLQMGERHFERGMNTGVFDEVAETESAEHAFRAWATHVSGTLQEVFPTEREAFMFIRADRPPTHDEQGQVFERFWRQQRRIELFVRKLDAIRLEELPRYTDLPISARLYVEDIDSFSRVRDVNPALVADALKNGRAELAEEHVQLALEQILNVPLHRKDWAGETNDLYTANVMVNGHRTATAFLLKGRGCKAHELTIADCGKNGDQLLRLLDSPAQLFVVQFIGPVSDAVVKDIEGKVEHRRTMGKPSWFCVMDGQDTVRVLKAYRKLLTP